MCNAWFVIVPYNSTSNTLNHLYFFHIRNKIMSLLTEPLIASVFIQLLL